MNRVKNYGYEFPERQIMLYSEFVKNNFDDIYKVIKNYESLNEKKIDKNNIPNKERFERLNITRIFNQAKDEWTAVKEGNDLKLTILNDKDKIHCEICNQPIKKIFYIVNKINSKELKVGCECIHHYEINIELQKNVNRDVYIRKQERRAEIIKLRNEFNKRFPDAEYMLEDWNDYYNQLPIVIPNEITNQYNSLVFSANKLYNSFIEGKIDKNKIKSFAQLREDINNKQNGINTYIKNNKDKNLVVTKDIEKTLLLDIDIETKKLDYSLRKHILKRLRKKGFIDKDTLPYIREKNFINKHIDKIKAILKEYNFTIKNIDYDNSSFNITYNEINNLILNINMYNLLNIISDILIDGKNIQSKNISEEIIQKSNVSEEDSKYLAITELAEKLKKYDIHLIPFVKSNNGILRYGNKGYKKIFIDLFIKKHIDFLLLNSKSSLKDILEGNNEKYLLPIEKMKDDIQYYQENEEKII